MNPTDKQVGGTHYKTAIQPVQYIYANNLNFFEGNVIKYITRHRSKGGKADLEKAIHYIEMLMEFEYPDSNEFLKNFIAGENLKDGDFVAVKDGKAFKVGETETFMVDGIIEAGRVSYTNSEKINLRNLQYIKDMEVVFNEEIQSIQVNIPDDTVVEKGIIIDGVTYPLNPDLYITAPERKSKYRSCSGCIFNGKNNSCAVSGSILNHECYQKKIIYKSLKT